MKIIFSGFLFIFLFLLPPTNAQVAVKKMIQQMKKTEAYDGISLPGWMVKLGLKLASDDNKDNTGNSWLQITNKLRYIDIAHTTLDIKVYNPQAVVSNFIQDLKNVDGFDEYISLKQEDQHLKVLVIDENDLITNIVILNHDNGEITLFHLETNLTYNDIKALRFSDLRS